jgi:hypothetical protein
MTNATAEKHDGFISVQGDGTVITEFTGQSVWCRANRMDLPFRMGVCVLRLKLAATQRGMSPVLPM